MLFTWTKTDGLTELQSKKKKCIQYNNIKKLRKIMQFYLHHSDSLFFGQLQRLFVLKQGSEMKLK